MIVHGIGVNFSKTLKKQLSASSKPKMIKENCTCFPLFLMASMCESQEQKTERP